VPFAIGSLLPNKAHAQTKQTLINVLNYLLRFEFIVEELYAKAIVDGGPIPGSELELFKRVAVNNKAHIQSLSKIITDLGGAVVPLDKAKIDLSGGYGTNGGPFGGALSNFEEF